MIRTSRIGWILALAAFVALSPGCGSSSRGTPGGTAEIGAGHRLFLDGRFDEAQRELEARLQRAPDDTLARRILGRILMLKGRYRESARLLHAILPRSEAELPEPGALQDYFWALYRLDDYVGAASVAQAVQDFALAMKYDEISQRGPPYTTTWRRDSCVLPMEGHNLVSVRAAGEPGTFGVDFGGGEVLLDDDYAAKARARVIGVARPGALTQRQGILESLDLGALQVRNIPAVVTALPREPDRRIDGVLGVGFLSHFRTTLDLRRKRLVLRPRDSGEASGEAWPLFYAGDRNLFVPAEIDGLPAYVIVNPSLAGVRFAPSRALLLRRPRPERVRVGRLEIPAGPPDMARFPPGVDEGYGFVIHGMLGADAFAGKAITFDFVAMRVYVD